MRDTSWYATGLVQPIWSRLDGKHKRERLAELTGIPANNLSQLNTGGRPMTWGMAMRICAAVPGATPFDLGAPSAPDGEPDGMLVLDRLAKAEDAVDRLLAALDAAGIEVPAVAADSLSSPTAP